MANTDKLYPRPEYGKLLDSYLGSGQVKVLSGVRRCGKSTLLQMLIERLRSAGVPASNILFRKMDSYDAPLEPSVQWLDSLLKDSLEGRDPAFPVYALFDEIQEVPGWEKAIRRAHTEGAFDVFLTGSNAFLLSSDLTTYLSGRYVEIPVWPLSFKEYSEFCSLSGAVENSQEKLFSRYVRFGGMPGLFGTADFSEAQVTRELTAIHDTVVLNDVAKRFEIRDIDFLEKLIRYVYTTSGTLFSARKIAGALTSMGRKTYGATVESYLGALERAYLLGACEQEGIAGKQLLQPLRKWFAPDTGLRNREIGFQNRDMGLQLENVVFCELRRRGYSVTVGAGCAGEVDFVARRNAEKIYVQVCDEIPGDATLERELSSFDGIDDSFPKLVLTRDKLHLGVTEKGVQVSDLEDWLLG